MLKKIEDIRNALNNKTYYCALALALTLPDVCCHVENHLGAKESASGKMYIEWLNKHTDPADFKTPFAGFDKQTFSSEMCYLLRCKVLHNGNTEVKNEKQGVWVDKLVLTFPSDANYYHGYDYQENGGKTATYIGIDYLCERLCAAAERFYNEWENKEDFDKFSF